MAERCKTKFYICKHCGNIVEMVDDSGVVPVCCGESMHELVANTTDGAHEKHVPVVTVNGNEVKVAVGSAAHPMENAHFIEFIQLKTSKGIQRHVLNPSEKPEAVFALSAGEKAIAAYEYCNLHGLWKADV